MDRAPPQRQKWSQRAAEQRVRRALQGRPDWSGTVGAVPSGAPQTGFGGASRSRDGGFILAGVIALIGAGLALTVAFRRRQTLPTQGADDTA